MFIQKRKKKVFLYSKIYTKKETTKSELRISESSLNINSHDFQQLRSDFLALLSVK